ncbi:MAG: DUF6495 family protein, partial [Bacteroidota bacterium]
AVNGIDGPEWQKLKEQSPGRADGLLLQFSQMVFTGVIEKLTHLIQRSKRDIRTYHCLQDKIRMNGLLVEGVSDIDLTQTELPAEEMISMIRASGAQVKLYSGERPYREGDRAQDIFLLMEQGALIADASMFDLLEGLKQ